MPKHVFISCAERDMDKAHEICEYLEQSGIPCWTYFRDMLPGDSYRSEIINAIESSVAVLLVLSPDSSRSSQVANEVRYSLDQRLQIVPILIEKGALSHEMSLLIGHLTYIDVSSARWPEGLKEVVKTLAQLIPHIENSTTQVPQKRQEPNSKGYVFISYSRDDSDFIIKLKDILKRRGYAYWDYSESERDFHNALYKELEEKIENAKAFMCIVTDSWRETEWPAAEYIYAREAQVPVFVIQAKKLARPVPIIINQQTRINMVGDFARGARILEHELDKKGL